MSEASFTAAVALLAWPLIALWLFSTMPRAQGLLWTTLGGFLLLPVGAAIKFEGLPEFDKTAAISLAAVVGCLASGWRPRMWRRIGIVEILVCLYVLGPVVTGVLNSEPAVAGGRWLPGTSLYDGLSASISQILALAPFFLGRQLLKGASEGEQVLRVLVLAGLLYSLPMLFEMRMSPQLHNWIYGYFQSSFVTESRYGGFRAVVFLPNGLVLALFVVTTLLAAVALGRTRSRIFSLPSSVTGAYLALLLVLCKSAGALTIALIIAPLVRFARPILQMRVAVILVVVALAYPTLRSADLLPTYSMVDFASTFSDDRAMSLQTRFGQEEILLDRASSHYWFGWGRFGRSRVYDEDGKDISLTDGYWLIIMGSFGIVGFIATFGLLAVPVVRAAKNVRQAETEPEAIHLAALALIIAAIVVDQLPNSSLSPWTWLLTGTLLGRAEALGAVGRNTLGPTRERASLGFRRAPSSGTNRSGTPAGAS